MNQDSPKRQRLKLLNSYIIILLLVISSLPLHAQAGIVAKRMVNLNYTKVSAATLLNEMAKQSKYNISFNTPVFERLQLSNIRYTNIPLSVVLKDLEKKTKLSFMISGNHISADINESKVINQQPGRISGKIVDDKGEPLPGASIKLIELGRTITSSVDGSYSFSVEPGTYTIEVSYISFQTKRIGDIVTKAGLLTKLDVVLKVSSNALSEVVVRSSFKKESIAGLYAQQKNAASMTDGISAEQIARTPDNNVGTILKRVSGITTIDNKYVVVRGMSERYNQAMVDGIVLPSTDMNRRNFSFDVVPAELVSSVVVNKTATPDVSSEFSGGQVTVNTLAIPETNFMSFGIGSGFNDRTIGKDVLQVGGRGKYDYFGFDDGRRKQPEGIKYWVFRAGGNDDNPLDYEPTALEQSKRFNPDGFKLYKNTTRPNQNYRFALGRLYDLNQKMKIGFVAGLTYRNTQEVNNYTTTRGYGNADLIDTDSAGRGTISKFNTTWGATLNGGLQGEKFKINMRNLYTRMLSDDSYDVYKRQNDDFGAKERSIFADPVFTDILQNKLEGEHRLTEGGLLLNWSGARTQVTQEHKDLRSFTYRYTTRINGVDLYQTPGLTNNNNVAGDFNYDYRLWTNVEQTDYNWMLSLSQPFNFLKDKSLLKIGYMGWQKDRKQGTLVARLFSDYTGKFFELYEPYENVLSPDRIGYGQDKGYYFADAENGGDQYKGKSKNNSFYLMLDQRFFQKLRVVYGVRAENFNSKNAQLAEIETRRRLLELYPDVSFSGRPPLETGEKNWRYLPSVNLTYSLSSEMNFRAAYSVTMIRPDLRETATMSFVDPLLRGPISGGNLSSTRIDNYDVRYEWYPSSGEIISVSGFYKKFDKPVELMKTTSVNEYYFTNQKSATNLGAEIEIRKSLGFIADKKWLNDLSLFGNATIMKSKVIQDVEVPVVVDGQPTTSEIVERSLKRPLYGQSPYILNAGVTYSSKYFGLNAVYNKFGYRTYTIEDNPSLIEFENGRDVIDLQLNTRLLKQKAEIRFNISNLLDTEALYYVNANGYQVTTINGHPDVIALPGTSDKYKKAEGDQVKQKIKYGRTFNLSFTYNF